MDIASNNGISETFKIAIRKADFLEKCLNNRKLIEKIFFRRNESKEIKIILKGQNKNFRIYKYP